MEDLLTLEALAGILSDEGLTPRQRAERVLDLHGQAMARAADPTQSDAYRALAGEFDAYRAMQAARTGRDFAGVKPKFFETVYSMVDRGEGARPVAEQLAGIREAYEEYFVGETPDPAPGRPAPAVVLPAGGQPGPGAKLTLGEAMRRANAGESVDISQIG